MPTMTGCQQQSKIQFGRSTAGIRNLNDEDRVTPECAKALSAAAARRRLGKPRVKRTRKQASKPEVVPAVTLVHIPSDSIAAG